MSFRLFRRSEIERREADDGTRFVVCQRCGHVVSRESAKLIRDNGSYDGVRPFCQTCAPQYDEVLRPAYAPFSSMYYRKVRVTEDGEPFGYVKAPVAKESKR